MSRPALSSGALSLSLDPSRGGRVAQVAFRGQPLLAGPEAHPDNWGATFWTSPQADWGWPPVAEVDSLPYEILEQSPSGVGLRSRLAVIGERRFFVEKWFRPAPGDSFDACYVIESASSAPFRLAAWEISRLGPGGLTFFPTGELELTPIDPHGPLMLAKRDGLSFCDHGAFRPGRSLKVHADGQGGFVAHRAANLLLVKMFEDSPPRDQAPGEGEVELFFNEDGRYIELEVQGPYALIAPGQRVEFRVRTQVVELERDESLSLAALAGRARALRASHRSGPDAR